MYSVYSDAVAKAIAEEISNNNVAFKVKWGTLGVLGGAIGLSSESIQSIWDVLCGTQYSWGKGVGGICGGSVLLTDLGWCNFLYIPHRTGTGSDNWRYGTLLLFPMTQGAWVRIYRTTSTGFVLIKIL